MAWSDALPTARFISDLLRKPASFWRKGRSFELALMTSALKIVKPSVTSLSLSTKPIA